MNVTYLGTKTSSSNRDEEATLNFYLISSAAVNFWSTRIHHHNGEYSPSSGREEDETHDIWDIVERWKVTAIRPTEDSYTDEESPNFTPRYGVAQHVAQEGQEFRSERAVETGELWTKGHRKGRCAPKSRRVEETPKRSQRQWFVDEDYGMTVKQFVIRLEERDVGLVRPETWILLSLVIVLELDIITVHELIN